MRQLASGTAAVHSFVLDHDYAWADGLICGGQDGDRHPAGARPRAARLLPGARPGCSRTGDGFTEAVVVDWHRRGRGCAAGHAVSCSTADGRLGRSGRPARSPTDSPQGDRRSADRPRPSVHDGVAFLPSLARGSGW